MTISSTLYVAIGIPTRWLCNTSSSRIRLITCAISPSRHTTGPTAATSAQARTQLTNGSLFDMLVTAASRSKCELFLNYWILNCIRAIARRLMAGTTRFHNVSASPLIFMNFWNILPFSDFGFLLRLHQI